MACIDIIWSDIILVIHSFRFNSMAHLLSAVELTLWTATWLHAPGAAPQSMTLKPGFRSLYLSSISISLKALAAPAISDQQHFSPSYAEASSLDRPLTCEWTTFVYISSSFSKKWPVEEFNDEVHENKKTHVRLVSAWSDVTDRSAKFAQNLSNRWVIHYCDVFVFRITY